MNGELHMVKAGGAKFAVRDGTSDIKAVDEVVTRKAYARKGMTPEKGETWLDVGANCGAFSVWAARLGAKIIAFEPDTENALIARTNVDLNGLGKMVEFHDVALIAEDKASKLAFHRNISNGNLWRNSLYKQWRGGETIAVRGEPIKQYWRNKYCIKIDAEGVEMPILEKYADSPVTKLIFEWSFDIDPSISRFEKVISRLKKTYEQVSYAGYSSGYAKWQPSWFPACRTIWCK